MTEPTEWVVEEHDRESEHDWWMFVRFHRHSDRWELTPECARHIGGAVIEVPTTFSQAKRIARRLCRRQGHWIAFRVRNVVTGEVRRAKPKLTITWRPRPSVQSTPSSLYKIQPKTRFLIVGEHPDVGWIPLPTDGRPSECVARHYVVLAAALKEMQRVVHDPSHEATTKYHDLAVLHLDTGKVYTKHHLLTVEAAGFPLTADAFEAAVEGEILAAQPAHDRMSA